MINRELFKDYIPIFEEFECEECGKLIFMGEGDLNCCHFLCPECFNKLGKEIQ